MTTIVSLTENPLDDDVLKDFSFEVLHIPIIDRKAPTEDQIEEFVGFLDEQLGRNRRVVTHCLGGYGRTGTMLCSYLVHCGLEAHTALKEIRRVRPGSAENEDQENAS